MLRFGLFLVFALNLALPSIAKAGCTDCPFPMAKLFGSWSSDSEREFTVIISEEFRTYEEVVVKVVIWDNENQRMVAMGYGKGDPSDTTVRVQVRFENGMRSTYHISVDRLGKNVIMDRSGNALHERSCEPQLGCFMLKPKKVRTYKARARMTIA